MSIPEQMLPALAPFIPLFSDRVWIHAQTLLLGALLSPSRRTVATALRVMDRADDAHFTNFHRVLNRAVWSTRTASKILLGLILAAFPSDAILLSADDTIERRRGRRIRAAGVWRDPTNSSLRHQSKCFGLRWISMMALVRVPWSSRVWALPFLTVLTWPKGTRRRHKTCVGYVCQLVRLVRRWLPDRALVLVADGTYAAYDVARACQKARVTLVTRLRLDAALYHAPGPRRPGQRGRPLTKGGRQRRLSEWAARGDSPWQTLEVAWYSGQRKQLKVLTRTALWWRSGNRPVPIRWVLVRDEAPRVGQARDQAFLCTQQEASAEQIIEWVVMRWSVEVTFEETRAHLGIETQRQWSDHAIERTTPVLYGLYSIVTLMTVELGAAGIGLEPARAAWYAKKEATFSDCIGLVRRTIWRHRYFERSAGDHSELKFTLTDLERLLACLQLSA
jgi:hypothetical protein